MMNRFGKELGEYLNFNNISDKEFAERIGTTPKNLNDIINGKIALSTNMIYNISFITSIPVNYIESVEANFKMDQTISKFISERNITIKNYIKKFNYKELSEKYDIKYTDSRNDYDILKDILRFLRITNPSVIYKENNSIFYKSKNDKPEIMALWLEKCYKETLMQNVDEYKNENINKIVIEINNMANDNIFDQQKLIKLFNQNGIFLAIVDDLSGGKIRGAFKVLNDKPAIFLTKKHKRIADVYFALLHELAHCQSDFNRAKSGSIISEINVKSNEDFEKRADATAFNWMIPDDLYNKIKSAKMDSNEMSIVKSFFVYRLAYDNIISYSSNEYQRYNILLKEY